MMPSRPRLYLIDGSSYIYRAFYAIGGGITIAAAGLVPDVVAAMPDVPFLCHYRRATELVDSYPTKRSPNIATSIAIKWIQSSIRFRTSMASNISARAKDKTLFSTALMDQDCPPSTVFAAYNHWAGEKDIKVYPYNGHEGGGSYQTLEKVKFLKSIW